ncbi:MAG: GNAT family N-acetyltransferase [Stackebrandtia sp.]
MNSPSPALPSPYHVLPAAQATAAVVHRIIAAVETDLFGRVETGEDHVDTVLARPGLDPGNDTVLVGDAAGEAVAWAWVNRRSEVYVHPRHRGRGLGTALNAWTQERAHAAGDRRTAQMVPDGDHAAVALMTAAGFTPHATAWFLGTDIHDAPAPVIPGIDIRAYRSGDAEAAHDVIETAFAGWQGRRKPFSEWAAGTIERSSFAPDASVVVLDGDRLVGALIALEVPEHGEGFVDCFAIDGAWRRRGIGAAMLRESFAAFARRGFGQCTLWTHSDTGALSLYERVGMTVRRSTTVFGKSLVDAGWKVPPRGDDA